MPTFPLTLGVLLNNWLIYSPLRESTSLRRNGRRKMEPLTSAPQSTIPSSRILSNAETLPPILSKLCVDFATQVISLILPTEMDVSDAVRSHTGKLAEEFRQFSETCSKSPKKLPELLQGTAYLLNALAT